MTETHSYGDGCSAPHGPVSPKNLMMALGGPDTEDDIRKDPDLYFVDAASLPAGRRLSLETWRQLCSAQDDVELQA